MALALLVLVVVVVEQLNLICPPAIWYPGQEKEQWQQQLDDLWIRVHLHQQWLDDKLPTDCFLDHCHQTGIDPFSLVDLWGLPDG